jgi:cytochrome bd-type quinol oxidase subunit 1
MSYQDELREQAQKRAKRDYRNKMIMLVIFLVVVLAVIHILGKESDKLTKDQDPVKVEQVENKNAK